MSKVRKSLDNINVGVIGSVDFQRRIESALKNESKELQSFACTPVDAWSEILAHKPNCIVLEIGIQHNQKEHALIKDFLSQLRDRFKQDIYVVVALMAPDKLLFGGDLLFVNDKDMEPSGYVDTFIAQPPMGFPTTPSIAEQINQTVSLLAYEFERREEGLPATPALAADGWVHSLADPKSRELWMLWLPRYASYTNENPIITGPTGAGKTRLAKALHILSGLKGPFISMTPRDFSSSELIQAELFGAVAGAYTGAVDKWGLVKSAENGTLFMDELQSIDKELQGKLITFVENKTYRRVGSAETIEANVRFVFATNKPIPEMVENDTLREDFAYRLERVSLHLLPLRLRKLDIAAAFAFALAKIRRQRPQTNPILGASTAAYRLLFGYSWPGNLRQLENAAAQLCEISDINGEEIIEEQSVRDILGSTLLDIAVSPAEVLSQAALRLSKSALSNELQTLEDGLIQFKQEAFESALATSSGDVEVAAKLLSEETKILELYNTSKSAETELKARK